MNHSVLRARVLLASLVMMAIASSAAVVNDGSKISNLTRIGNLNGTGTTTSFLSVVALTNATTTNFVLQAEHTQDVSSFPLRAAWYSRDLYPTSGVYKVTADFLPATSGAIPRGGVMGWINTADGNGIALQVRQGDVNSGFQVSIVNFTAEDPTTNDVVDGLFNLDGSPATADTASAWSELGTTYDATKFATFQLEFAAPSAAEKQLVTNATAHVTAKVFQGVDAQSNPVQVSRTVELLSTLPVPAANMHRAGYYAYWGTIRDQGGVIGDLDNLTLAGSLGAATNAAPIVSFITPTNNTPLPSPSDIEIQVSATDPDGIITRVDIYNGTNKLTTITQAPYNYLLTDAPAGRYSFTAVAVDDNGLAVTSAPPSVVILNNDPAAELLAPANDTVFVFGNDITFTVGTSDPDGYIAKVEIINRDNNLNSVVAILTNTNTNKTPFDVVWKNPPHNTFTNMFAKVTDNLGGVATTASIELFINNNQPPSVTLTSPTNTITVSAGTTLNFEALAFDPDGRVTNVVFYSNRTNLIGSVADAPFALSTNSLPVGTNDITAIATDNVGIQVQSTERTIVIVTGNKPPTVTLTSPANGASFKTNDIIQFSATASDSDGTIARVNYLMGTNIVGSATTPPYSFNLSNLKPGQYVVSAIAIDNGGASSTPSSVNIAVGGTVVNTNQPKLQFTATGNSLTISWSSQFLGYTLQLNTNLASQTWTDVPGSSTTTSVTISTTGVQTYYRLIQKGGVTPPPTATLTIDRSGTGVVVSWASSITGYRLQSSPSVGLAATWSAITTTNNRYTNSSPSAATTFYRLISP